MRSFLRVGVRAVDGEAAASAHDAAGRLLAVVPGDLHREIATLRHAVVVGEGGDRAGVGRAFGGIEVGPRGRRGCVGDSDTAQQLDGVAVAVLDGDVGQEGPFLGGINSVLHIVAAVSVRYKRR